MDLSNPINLIIAAIYFILVGTMTFFSVFGVYILVRYGKSQPLSVVISIIYIIFFLQVLEQSYRTLQSIH